MYFWKYNTSFLQVLQGSAEGLNSEGQSKVVVKMLKDDAMASEKTLFLEEIAPYRFMYFICFDVE